jgi:hypothetical protein
LEPKADDSRANDGAPPSVLITPCAVSCVTPPSISVAIDPPIDSS